MTDIWIVSEQDSREVRGVFYEQEAAQELADAQSDGIDWEVRSMDVDSTTSILETLMYFQER